MGVYPAPCVILWQRHILWLVMRQTDAGESPGGVRLAHQPAAGSTCSPQSSGHSSDVFMLWSPYDSWYACYAICQTGECFTHRVPQRVIAQAAGGARDAVEQREGVEKRAVQVGACGLLAELHIQLACQIQCHGHAIIHSCRVTEQQHHAPQPTLFQTHER